MLDQRKGSIVESLFSVSSINLKDQSNTNYVTPTEGARIKIEDVGADSMSTYSLLHPNKGTKNGSPKESGLNITSGTLRFLTQE